VILLRKDLIFLELVSLRNSQWTAGNLCFNKIAFYDRSRDLQRIQHNLFNFYSPRFAVFLFFGAEKWKY
jgi:hypothetical protein